MDLQIREENIHPVLMIDSLKVLRPKTRAGDDFYGLSRGTNGDAARARRTVVENLLNSDASFRWETSDAKHAAGLMYVPTGRSDEFENPWPGVLGI